MLTILSHFWGKIGWNPTHVEATRVQNNQLQNGDRWAKVINIRPWHVRDLLGLLVSSLFPSFTGYKRPFSTLSQDGGFVGLKTFVSYQSWKPNIYKQ